MPFADFRQVRDLPPERQRELLASGDATEKVWALWSLALASASSVAYELRTLAGAEPSAGVRRHVATVLAGQGDRQTLGSLASLDPDVTVRASACRLLARTAPSEDVTAWGLLCEVLGSAHREVRLAVLDGLTSRSPERAWAACRQLLDSGELELRSAALDAAIQKGFAAQRFPSELREMLARESDPGLRGRLLGHWLEVSGPDAVAQGLIEADARIVLHFLELARRLRPEPAWAVLFPLAERHDPEIDERLAELAGAPLDWLMEVVRRHLTEAGAEERDSWQLQRAAQKSVSRLEEELPRAGAEALGYEGLTVARALRDVVAGEVRKATAEPDPWDDEPQFVLGETLLPELDRLLVSHQS